MLNEKCLTCGNKLETWKSEKTKTQEWVFQTVKPIGQKNDNEIVLSENIEKEEWTVEYREARTTTRNKILGYHCLTCDQQWTFKQHIDSQTFLITENKSLKESIYDLIERITILESK